MYPEEQNLDLNLYHLKEITTNEKMNLNFGASAFKLNNDLWLIGLLKTEYWIFSQVSMNLYLLQLLIASWWSGVLMCLCKNAADKQIKMKKSYVTAFIEQDFQK